MSKCGPLHSQSWRASSDRPTHKPLRVPTMSTVAAIDCSSRRFEGSPARPLPRAWRAGELATLGDQSVRGVPRSEEHTSELQSLMRNSYAVFCLKKKNLSLNQRTNYHTCEHTPLL